MMNESRFFCVNCQVNHDDKNKCAVSEEKNERESEKNVSHTHICWEFVIFIQIKKKKSFDGGKFN